MRQAEANVKRYSTATYSIDRAELFALRDDKLLPLRHLSTLRYDWTIPMVESATK
jgi:hypothetical protein